MEISDWPRLCQPGLQYLKAGFKQQRLRWANQVFSSAVYSQLKEGEERGCGFWWGGEGGWIFFIYLFFLKSEVYNQLKRFDMNLKNPGV